MASGTYNLSLEHSSSSVTFQGQLRWSSTSNGTTANSSNVTVELYARKQGSSTATSGTFKGYITIDGTKVTFSQSKSVSNSWVKISTSSKTVSHNADGTKSITIAGAVGKVSGTTLASIESNGSTSITLDTIPRYATILTAPNFNDEQNPTITYTNPAGNNVTTLQACISFDNINDNIPYRDISKTGSSYTFNLTEAERTTLRNYFNTSSSGNVYFYIKCILNGNTDYSIFQKTVTIINANPTWTITPFSFYDTNSSVVAVTGNAGTIVQGLSNVSIDFNSATGQKGASISSYSFKVGNNTYTTSSAGTFNIGTLNTNGRVVIDGTATDSRGITTTSRVGPYMIYEYFNPIVFIELERLNNYEDTTYLKGIVSYANVNNTNILTMTYRYKEVGGSYGAWTSITPGVQTTLTLDKQKEFEFEVKVVDSFGGTATTTAKLNKGVFPLFIDTSLNSVGINKFPQYNDTLEVGGTLATFGGSITVGGNVSLDTDINKAYKEVELSMNNTNGTKGNIHIASSSGADLVTSYIGIYGERKTANDELIDSFLMADGGVTLEKNGYNSVTINPLGSSVNDLTVNGFDIAKNKVLWSGAIYMNASQTANLSESVSSQAHGIVLIWSAYSNGSAVDARWHCFFVPKEHVARNTANGGYNFVLAGTRFGNMATKYVYIKNTQINGHADNQASGTGSGITYDNSSYVLRYVIGV